MTIAGHSADLKQSATSSKDTGIFLPPDLITFLGSLTNLSFTIYKEDCIRALTALVFSLPLYSNKGGKIITHGNKFQEFSSLLNDIEAFFGNNPTAIYDSFSISTTTQGRQYLYGLQKSSGFNIRKFFIADYTEVTFDKDASGNLSLRFKTTPVPNTTTIIPAIPTGKTEQIIYYGAPGTGKSFLVDEKLKKAGVPEDQVSRVIFYPDYSYTDFVGGLGPKQNGNTPIYDFIEGPFTALLKKALDNPNLPYYMVIEEINRGNPAAIFGDLFQLLDRDSNGVSTYSITNKEVCAFLNKGKMHFPNDRFRLPENLNIICTMNTADQNVFVLDTALKRRFAMEYVPIDFTKLDQNNPNMLEYWDNTIFDKANSPLIGVFANTTLSAYVGSHTYLDRNWPSFAELVNEMINISNREGNSISEDKKLGPFFVSKEEIKDRKKFADKVLYYLKQDVFKYTEGILKLSYQELYDSFVNKGEDIFELLVR